MKTTYKITDLHKYNKSVITVHTDALKSTDNYNNNGSFCATGDITIIEADGTNVNSTGEHGSRDFEEQYGFVLIPDNE